MEEREKSGQKNEEHRGSTAGKRPEMKEGSEEGRGIEREEGKRERTVEEQEGEEDRARERALHRSREIAASFLGRQLITDIMF
ncbi:hypothetical protein K0M31_003906 [Melipona bicolor]|uniref:Uncharacterized protein n=1 Tax=Melipona bicolor TaxID=60889 RepID=A0AA40KP16_9HYME|nr:hypothetical protein K0M31_003906 [Melipona bicolor]